MEPSASAFAVYKANKPPKNKKKRKRSTGEKFKSTKANGNNSIEDNLLKSAAQKLKKKLKSKEHKSISKTKSQKKNKSKSNKKRNGISTQIKNCDKFVDDEIPALIPVPVLNTYDNVYPEDDILSTQSTNGSFDFAPVQTDSSEEGLKVFKWMIAPYDPDIFLNEVWEKKPLHISRKKSNYYKEIISTPIIDDMLRNKNVLFTKNVDITSYVNEVRETHNPEGRARPHLVWDAYLNGCSVRLLNPQTYISKLHLMNATLQEFFNCFVGANAYLTPPDSQGFAPHYDDIEAFILQAEGKKSWRIYKPRCEEEVLPRVSSKNFDQNEIGSPIMEVTLEAGDMLYFPRGYIHQGVTINGEHSLHVTVSMYQKHSFADLFEHMIPGALQMAINEIVDFRRGLPLDIYDNFGLVNSDVTTPRKLEIQKLLHSLFDRIKEHLSIDEAVDQMHKNYQHDALPPVLSDSERAVTVYGDTDVMRDNGIVVNRVEIGLDTRIRLLRKNILRIVSEDAMKLYFYSENSLEYHGNDLQYIEIEEDLAPAIETLITTYPEYVSVENLDLTNDEDKVQVAQSLWSRGLIMTEYPLENIDDD